MLYNYLSSPLEPMTTATRRYYFPNIPSNQSKVEIYDLADVWCWETVAKEMVARMSGDEAREFVADFRRLYEN
jgi:hypothetical protein